MKLIFSLYISLLITIPVTAQMEKTDTAILSEIVIKSFNLNRTAFTATAAIRSLSPASIDFYHKNSLVNGLNTIAGVRMEERSPGSYRINIRGSSLRSPFGVRNVKVYWNDIPVTDAGGNTYFNQFTFNNFSSLELFKGPPGSLYGAGTAGLILLQSLDNWKPEASVEYIGGSFATHSIFSTINFGSSSNQHQVSYNHQQSDGYRVQAAMKRDNISWSSKLKLTDKHQLSASLLYNSLYYQTPGALTLTEYTNNPKAARPAAGLFPSAEEARAAIFQKNITVGFTNTYQFTSALKNSTTLFGIYNQIKNAAVRNYERRSEPQWGGRSVFQWNFGKGTTTGNLTSGGEWQQGFYNVRVAGNKNGHPDTLQTNDDVQQLSYSLFTQADLNINEKWFITAGFSFSKNKVSFTRLSDIPVLTQQKNYQNELMPRIAVLRKLNNRISLLASVAKGFSPPTTGELLPSTGIINTALEAEKGWTTEATARYPSLQNKLSLEATVFYFALNNTLAQRRDASGADYFVNAGTTRQQGIELQADYLLSFRKTNFISTILFSGSYTYHHFRYGNFEKNGEILTGKKLPSVPANAILLTAATKFARGYFITFSYNSVGKIFLNENNTAHAESYQLAGIKLGRRMAIKQINFHLYAGADNLFDERYSLGNDINAAAGRYYNAAPGRNFYAGILLQLPTGRLQ